LGGEVKPYEGYHPILRMPMRTFLKGGLPTLRIGIIIQMPTLEGSQIHQKIGWGLGKEVYLQRGLSPNPFG